MDTKVAVAAVVAAPLWSEQRSQTKPRFEPGIVVNAFLIRLISSLN